MKNLDVSTRRLIMAVLGIGLVAALFWFFVTAPEKNQNVTLLDVPNVADTSIDNPPTEPEAPPEVANPAATPAPGETAEQERARQADKVRVEMRFALTKAYTTQKEFFEEFKRYTTDLRLTGWDYDAKSLNFKMGFLQPGHAGGDLDNEDPQDMDTDLLIRDSKDKPVEEARTYSELADGLQLREFSRLCANGCTANEQGFEIMAVSKIGPGGKAEVWTINEKKQLRQLQD